MQENNVLNLGDVRSVWRVFNPEYLLHDIEQRRLTLVRPSSWDDPFENFLEKCRFKLPTGEPVDATPVLGRFFGQCWTMAPDETDATWRIYSPSKIGVRVRSSIVSLGTRLCDASDPLAAVKYFVGSVSYVSYELLDVSLRHAATAMLTGNGGRNLVQTLLIKRREFEHEREVRLIFYDAEDQFKGQPLWSVAIEPDEVFEEAVFDPRMPAMDVVEWTRRFRAAGFHGPISQSTLYRPPSWEITLD